MQKSAKIKYFYLLHKNSSDFSGLLCTIFYTIYIIIGVSLVWTNPEILFTTGKHGLFAILRRLHALLGYGSIITLDAQKNAVCAICIFYTLQYSMILLYFCNLPFAFGVIMLQMQQKTGRSMRILDRIMYIDILFKCNNNYVSVHRLSSLHPLTYYFNRFITAWTVGI